MEDGSEGDGDYYGHAPTVVEALEHYTSKHGGDSLEGVLDWPWQRFEAMYTAMIRRELVDEMKHRKITMIGALNANSGWQNEEDLPKAVDSIEENYDQSVALIYGDRVLEEEDDIDFENNPFFAAAKKGMDKFDVPSSHGDSEITTQEMMDLDKDIKEAGLDQL